MAEIWHGVEGENIGGPVVHYLVYWPWVAPFVASATAPDLVTVVVTFSEPMVGADLTDPLEWAVVPILGGSAVTVLAAAHTATDEVTLTVTAMDPDTIHRATAPSNITSLSGVPIAGRVADCLTPAAAAETESGNPWAVAGDGSPVDLGVPFFDLVSWNASQPSASLRDAVWMSLHSDRRAADDDALPDTGGDLVYRGGWWADTYSGEKFGSRLWLLRRSAVTSEAINQTREYAIEALQWMIDGGLAVRVDVITERRGIDGVAMAITIYRVDGRTETIRYDDLWEVV